MIVHFETGTPRATYQRHSEQNRDRKFVRDGTTFNLIKNQEKDITQDIQRGIVLVNRTLA